MQANSKYGTAYVTDVIATGLMQFVGSPTKANGDGLLHDRHTCLCLLILGQKQEFLSDAIPQINQRNSMAGIIHPDFVIPIAFP